jgi:alpha-2-macroglobulin
LDSDLGVAGARQFAHAKLRSGRPYPLARGLAIVGVLFSVTGTQAIAKTAPGHALGSFNAGQAAAVSSTAVLGWSPGLGRDAPPDAPITVIFNRPMNQASVERAWHLSPAVAGSFRWTGQASTAGASHYTGALTGTSVTFLATHPLRNGSYYRLIIDGSAQSANGIGLVNPFSVAFTTGDALRVVSFTPASGTQKISVDGLISISFNHPMVALAGLSAPASNPAGWNLSIQPRVDGHGSWLGSSTWVFRPSQGLAPSTRYTVTLGSSARDAWGEALGRQLRWTFRTATPELYSRSPGNHAEFVNPHGPISVTFNQAMDHRSTNRAFSIRIGGRKIPGWISWRGTTLIFHLSRSLDSSRPYEVKVGGFAEAANRLATLGKTTRWEFNAAPAPRLAGTEPAKNGISWDLAYSRSGSGGPLRPGDDYGASLLFNTPMNKSSLDRHLRITPAIGQLDTWLGGPDDSGRFDYSIYGDFKPSTAYSITVSGGVRDQFGRLLPSIVSLPFKTSRVLPGLTLYGMPGLAGAVSFSAGQVAKVPEQVINIPTIHYMLERTTLAAISRLQLKGAASVPDGTPFRNWSVKPANVLNKLQTLSVKLLQHDGSALSPGLYWLNATTGSDLKGLPPDTPTPQSYEMIVASSVGVTMKTAPEGTLAWITCSQTGKPLRGATVRLVDYQGKTVARGATDAKGLHFFPDRVRAQGRALLVDDRKSTLCGGAGLFGLAEPEWTQTGSGLDMFEQTMLSRAYTGPAFTGGGGNAYGIYGTYAYGSSYAGGGTYLYTDRPIYRPGQSVRFRGLLWNDRDAVYSSLGKATAVVQAADGYGRVVYRRRITLDRFGAIHGSFRLPANAFTGTGYLTAWIRNGPNTSTNFTVAEYRKPEYLASISTARDTYIQGQTVKATIGVQYVFGAPVIHQRVSWIAYAQSNFLQPTGSGAYSFFDWETLWQENPSGPPIDASVGQLGKQVASGRGMTDAHGHLTISLPVDLTKAQTDRTLTIEVTASDLSHQNISARTTVDEYRSDLAIGLASETQITAAGHEVRVDASALTQLGTALAGQTLKVRISKRTYSSKLVTVQYGGQQTTAWQAVPHDTLVNTQTLTADAKGQATVAFTPAGGGEYVVLVQGKDMAGNPAENSLSVYVSGAGFSDWGLSNDTSITVKPDKATYHVGDTAHLLIAAPFDDASALVTIERGTIRSTRVEHFAANSPTIDVPVTLDDLPNVYVSVTIYRGWRNGSPPDWRSGSAELHVSVDPRNLKVRLLQNGSKHHPGDPVTYKVTTTDNKGKPVSAQLSLALVDKAVLALQDESNSDILSVFYAERSSQVVSASDGTISIDHLQVQPGFVLRGQGSVNADHRAAPALPVASLSAQKPSTGGGGAPRQAITVRSRFADTAYWTATLVTDRSGHGSVHLKLPDNATTWRLDARGVTAGHSVGQGRIETLATQDLVLRPVLPRFFLQGESVRLGAILNNNLGRAVTARISASTSGIALCVMRNASCGAAGGDLAGNAVSVTVPAHGERLVTWRGTVGTGTSVRFTVRAVPASSGVRGDAVLLAIPVHPPLTDETVAASGQIYGGIRQMIIVPRNAVSHPGELTVQLSASLAAGLGAAYGEFKPQPYESNEDIADRVLAASSLRSLPSSIVGLSTAQSHKLPADIAAGVRKLLEHQYPDGGWPWFNSAYEYSDPQITADVLQAFAASGWRGSRVRASVAAGRSYLIGQLSAVSAGERAHLLRVLTQIGFTPRKAALALYGNSIQRLHLGISPLAELGMTLGRIKDGGRAQSIISALDSQAFVSATGAHWEGSPWDSWGGPPIGATADVLSTLVALSPHDPFVPAAARWLMLARQGPGWDCSHDSALAIAALASYARAAREGTADYRYRVMLDGSQRMTGRYGPSNQRSSSTFHTSISQLHRNAANSLDVGRGLPDGSFGQGPLYYVTRLHYYLRAEAIAPRNEGVAVSRRYLDLKGKPVASAAAGSAVKVELTIHTDQSLLYVDVEDPIPVGFEPIDSSLNTSQQGIFSAPQYVPFGTVQDLTWYVEHTDLHDNRVSIYAYYLPPGTYRYTYLAQATIPGRYGVPPTHVAESFFPEVFGRSAGQTFRVK